MDQLEDLVKDFQTPKVAKVNLKALRDRDEASGRLVVDAFTPRFVDLEQRLDRLERNSRKTFRRTVLAGIIGGFGAAALWALLPICSRGMSSHLTQRQLQHQRPLHIKATTLQMTWQPPRNCVYMDQGT